MKDKVTFEKDDSKDAIHLPNCSIFFYAKEREKVQTCIENAYSCIKGIKKCNFVLIYRVFGGIYICLILLRKLSGSKEI